MNKKILIVDDDPALLEAMQMLLGEVGYEIKQADCGEEMRRELKIDLPDLILMDYKLPMTNGVELLKELKNQAKTSQVPVIMVSASNNVEKMAKKAGATEFIAKPFGMGCLLKAIERSLTK